jgi:hypothetical protein
MLKTRSKARPSRRPVTGAPVALVAIALSLAACAGGAATPSGTPNPTAGPATPQPTPTAVPGQDGSGNPGGTDPGSGGGTGGNPGTGILPPGITFPVIQVPDQSLLGEAKYLNPTKGLVNQRNASIQLLRAAIGDDGKAYADLRWYSGVEPCNALDSVTIARDDAAKTIALTVIEGSGPGDQMCIEIAELHAVAVDLGVLASGTWTISAAGDAPAIKLDVP